MIIIDIMFGKGGPSLSQKNLITSILKISSSPLPSFPPPRISKGTKRKRGRGRGREKGKGRGRKLIMIHLSN